MFLKMRSLNPVIEVRKSRLQEEMTSPKSKLGLKPRSVHLLTWDVHVAVTAHPEGDTALASREKSPTGVTLKRKPRSLLAWKRKISIHSFTNYSLRFCHTQQAYVRLGDKTDKAHCPCLEESGQKQASRQTR